MLRLDSFDQQLTEMEVINWFANPCLAFMMFIPCSLIGMLFPRICWRCFPLSQDVSALASSKEHNLAKIQADAMPEHYEAELEINDFQQNARWKVTHKETLGPISEWTRAAITTRGQYFAPAGSRTRGTKAVLVHHFLVQRNLADIQFFNSKSFIIRC